MPCNPAHIVIAKGSHPLSRTLVATLLILALGAGAWAWFAPRLPGDTSSTASNSPAAPATPAYVDNNRCQGCHAEQAHQWQGSHHAQAMARASRTTVRGDFGNRSFRHQGITSRFFQRDGRYFVNTDGPDGKPGDFEISYTFGVEPLQQYLIALPGGRLQALQIAWDDTRKRWFRLMPGEHTPAGDVLHWTGPYQTANTQCITCHTTGYEKRHDSASQGFASRWQDDHVACQACHGPGDAHVKWAEAARQGASPGGQPTPPYGLTASLKNSGAAQQADACSACHSRRSELVAQPVPGKPRLDQYLPRLLDAGLYHPDGQQLDEVFVDGSYRQSRMYQKGVACTACHNPHTGKLKHQGNALCRQCHDAPANSAFPTASGAYDTPAHHHHPAQSAGAQCVACHMPARTYMQIQPRPDHSLRIPRPDLTVKLGTPNACNQCHTDRSAQWAADQISQWAGERTAKRRQTPHYGELFAAVRAGRRGSNEALLGVISDAQQPGIVRATALSLLRGDPTTGLPVRLTATRDPDPEIRAAAADSYESVAPTERAYALLPLLDDPLRAVRLAALRTLSSVPVSHFDAGARRAFETALAEFITVQELALDTPGAHLNLAVVVENLGRNPLAETHYRAALKIDPDFTPARANLARLYNRLGRNADAEAVLREGVRRRPELGELHYSLGLLLAEEKKLHEASEALRKAARLMPGRARVHYNLGLALQYLGQARAAAEALGEAQRLDPLDPAAAQALAILFMQRGDQGKAREWAQVWLTLAPGDTQARRLLQQSSAAKGAAQQN